MFRKIMLLAAGVVALSLTACNGTAPTLPKLTFPQAVSLVCADGNAAINIMKDDGLFTGGALNTLNNTVTPDLNKVCAAGATVTTANLQTLTNVALPLLKSIVSASSLSPQAIKDANTAIDLADFVINTAVALAPAATASAASGASGASAASSPVAASAPVAASR